MESPNRFRLVEARCSGFASELLSQLEKHPSLPELLYLLEQIEGQIFRSDIESAFATLRKAPPIA